MERIDKETWKEHPSGLVVSDFGRVYVPQGSRGKKSHITYGHDCNGYLVVMYQGKNYRVHRLIGQCFIDNPENKQEIDHIDRNPKNNKVENLRWATSSENNYNREVPKNNALSKIVLQYTKSGEFVREWPSLGEVERVLGISRGYISACCNGKLNHAYNYLWKYK